MNEGTIALMIPIIALVIPIVAILTKHQKEMAALLNSPQPQQLQQGNPAQTAEMQRQIEELKRQLAIVQSQLPTPQGLNALNVAPPSVPGQVQDNRHNI